MCAHRRICIFLYLNQSAGILIKADNEFPGDYTYGETPVPIPNTEAKLVWPMVVLLGESRLSPGIYKGRLCNT